MYRARDYIGNASPIDERERTSHYVKRTRIGEASVKKKKKTLACIDATGQGS